jgi:hypothetical protein
LYTLPVTILLVCTWYNTKPSYHGMDWMMVGILTIPGCAWEYVFSDREWLPMGCVALIGLDLNTAALCLAGRRFSYIARRR